MMRKLTQAAQAKAGRGLLILALTLYTFSFTPLFAATHWSANLIVGGDGEDGACSNDPDVVTTVPGWKTVKGSPKLLCYTAGNYTTPDQSLRGKAFFSGGPYGDSILNQLVDVSSAHMAIDSGKTTIDFAGWFGGEGTNPGRASVALRFLAENGNAMGQSLETIPVTAEARSDKNRFLERKLIAAVPKGTRNISVTLEFLDTTITSVHDLKASRAINTGYADHLSLRLSAPVNIPVLKPPPSSVPPFDHVFLIMMENTTYADLMSHLEDMPFLKTLMSDGSELTNMVGIDHPSDQNYLAIAGGDAFVKGGVYFPNIRVNARHIGDSLEAIGKSWKGYEQGMGVPCGVTSQFDKYFDADDLPFINFTNIRDDRKRCEAHLLDASELRIDLKSTATTPNFVWIAADDYYDGEAAYNEGGLDVSLQAQDQWLRETMIPILNSPAWKSERSLFIVTWDESYYPFTQNHIPTFILASQGLVKAGYQDESSQNLYSIARTIEEALGIPALTANDRYASPLNEVFTEIERKRQ